MLKNKISIFYFYFYSKLKLHISTHVVHKKNFQWIILDNNEKDINKIILKFVKNFLRILNLIKIQQN